MIGRCGLDPLHAALKESPQSLLELRAGFTVVTEFEVAVEVFLLIRPERAVEEEVDDAFDVAANHSDCLPVR